MVLALVILQIVRRIGLVTEAEMVYRVDSALPVACKIVSRRRAMDIILPSGEIPHEITPVHPVHLIVEEIFQILAESRLPVLSSRYFLAFAAHVGFIEPFILSVRRGRPHTREKHLS